MPRPIPKGDIGRLRREAQLIVRQKPQRPVGVGVRSLAAALEELRIEGTELEIQNEHLQESRVQAEEAQQKYVRHFDLAPAGMMRLNSEGSILEANILAENML